MLKLKDSTKQFAIHCWKFCSGIPHSREYNAYANQLIRSSSSVGDNYRAAQRAKSSADFLNKLKNCRRRGRRKYVFPGTIEVLDWDTEIAKILHAECNEIISIVVASIKLHEKK